MTEVFLTAGELKGKRPIPRRCVVCGRSKARLVEASFALQAGHRWSLVTGSVRLMRYLTTSLPVCPEHRDYFSRLGFKALYIFLGVLGLFLLLMVVSTAAVFALGAKAFLVIAPVGFLAVLALFGFIAFLMISSRSGVHPRSITREGMVLANVAEEFADDLDVLRRQEGPEVEKVYFEEFSDDGGSRRRPSRRYEDDDDDDYNDENDDRPRRRRRGRG